MNNKIIRRLFDTIIACGNVCFKGDYIIVFFNFVGLKIENIFLVIIDFVSENCELRKKSVALETSDRPFVSRIRLKRPCREGDLFKD